MEEFTIFRNHKNHKAKLIIAGMLFLVVLLVISRNHAPNTDIYISNVPEISEEGRIGSEAVGIKGVGIQSTASVENITYLDNITIQNGWLSDVFFHNYTYNIPERTGYTVTSVNVSVYNNTEVPRIKAEEEINGTEYINAAGATQIKDGAGSTDIFAAATFLHQDTPSVAGKTVTANFTYFYMYLWIITPTDFGRLILYDDDDADPFQATELGSVHLPTASEGAGSWHQTFFNNGTYASGDYWLVLNKSGNGEQIIWYDSDYGGNGDLYNIEYTEGGAGWGTDLPDMTLQWAYQLMSEDGNLTMKNPETVNLTVNGTVVDNTDLSALITGSDIKSLLFESNSSVTITNLTLTITYTEPTSPTSTTDDTDEDEDDSGIGYKGPGYVPPAAPEPQDFTVMSAMVYIGIGVWAGLSAGLILLLYKTRILASTS